MNLSIFFTSVLLLKFGLLVSSERVTDELYRLLEIANESKGEAENIVVQQYDQTKTKINELLYELAIPSLNEINEDLEDYLENLQSDTSSLGYNSSRCVERFKMNLIVGAVSNVTEKAVTEMKVVHEMIISNIQTIGLYNMDFIGNEVFSISNETTQCLTSGVLDSCADLMLTRILAKQMELPVLFNNEVQRMTDLFLQQIVNYQSRVQEYLEEAVASVKPYLALLQTCVSVLLVSGME